ncbi:MAG: hypothetical protein EBV30_09150 [Actinobacteria bacterium]|nr:hypothetical protein [Actinomycetota bacterium]NBO56797.1 hypothetical protein [Actinomycetota bacterium]
MSVFDTGPSGGLFVKALSDLIGIGASLRSDGGFLTRLGPSIRRVLSNPNGVTSEYGGSLALDVQNGVLYVNRSVDNTPSSVWSEVATSTTSPIYGSFSDSTDQLFVVGDVMVVKYNTNESASGVSVANDPVSGRPTRITVSQTGVYAVSLSPQILHTGGGTEIITFWARIDGINVPRSASSLEMGNNNNRTLPYIELILSLTANQYVEWVFTASTGTNVTLEAYPAVAGPPAIPAIPSVILSIKRIA